MITIENNLTVDESNIENSMVGSSGKYYQFYNPRSGRWVKIDKRTDNAIKRKIELGKESDETVIQYLITSTSSSTMYEISKNLGWTTGKVRVL